MDEETLWKYIDIARGIYDVSKDPLALDAVRVIHEAITDTVTNTHEQPLSPMQLVVIQYLDKMETARLTLYG
jgi:hypothetical protein